MYDALHTWEALGHIEVTDVSLKFWAPLIRGVKPGKYKKGSRGYNTLIKAARGWAEDIISLLAKATPRDYVLVELICKTDAKPAGPRGMIRSLTAALSAVDTRGGMVPRPWDGRKPTKPKDVSEDVPFSAWDEGDDWELVVDEYDYENSYEGGDEAFDEQDQAYLASLYSDSGSECDKVKPKMSMRGHRFESWYEAIGQ